VPLDRLGTAALGDLAGSVSQLGDELLHTRAVRREIGGRPVDSRLEDHSSMDGVGINLYGTFTALGLAGHKTTGGAAVFLNGGRKGSKGAAAAPSCIAQARPATRRAAALSGPLDVQVSEW
jgi:hypothetical protein